MKPLIINNQLTKHIIRYLSETNIDGKSPVQMFNELNIPDCISITDDEADDILDFFASDNIQLIAQVVKGDKDVK